MATDCGSESAAGNIACVYVQVLSGIICAIACRGLGKLPDKLSTHVHSCWSTHPHSCWSTHVHSCWCAQEVFVDEDNDAAFEQLEQLLATPTVDILDECDELLASKFQLVYAWGSQEHLPALLERVHVLQAVLQVLGGVLAVTSLLRDGAVAQVQHHGGRYGAMPEIRLLAGMATTFRFTSLCFT